MTHRPYVHKPWKPGKKVRKTLDACARHWEERNRELSYAVYEYDRAAKS